MKNRISICNVIMASTYSGAIEYATNILNGTREPMGHENIARFQVDGPDYSSIMFFNHEGIPTEPTFGFKD